MYPYVGICLGMKVCIRAFNTSGIYNLLEVPLSEKKAIPHFVMDDMMEKTQCQT